MILVDSEFVISFRANSEVRFFFVSFFAYKNSKLSIFQIKIQIHKALVKICSIKDVKQSASVINGRECRKSSPVFQSNRLVVLP